ncbi:MAG: anti-sigma factor family protein [Thermodesulfobacteriota bacterium]
MAGRSKSKTRLQTVETCKDATSLLLEFMSGELDPEVTLEFEKHLEVCPDCVAFLNTYRKTVELTRSFLQKK